MNVEFAFGIGDEVEICDLPEAHANVIGLNIDRDKIRQVHVRYVSKKTDKVCWAWFHEDDLRATTH